MSLKFRGWIIILSFFPDPYPDELLYSVFARYHAWSYHESPKGTLDDLFGIRTITAIVDLPSNLGSLINNLPIGASYQIKDLIFQHTLYPFYAPFQPAERVKKVYQSMINDNGGKIYLWFGLMAGSVIPKQFLQYCPECAINDSNKYGELYWHRIHQVPGVFVCPYHNVFLENSTVRIKQDNRHEYISANLKNCMHISKNHFNDNLPIDRLIKLANEIKWLLDNCLSSHQLNWYQERYIQLLWRKGLVSSGGFVDQVSLNDEFNNYYGNYLLKVFDSDVDKSNENNWLRSIVRKHRKAFHPIRHILLIQYLTGTLEEFFNNGKIYISPKSPFGTGPWPCLNKVADHYNQKIIKTVKVTYDKDIDKPLGTFECTCGFIYSRRGPDLNYNDCYKIGRVKTFGYTWEAKLKELVCQNLSLRQIARNFFVDPATIKKYIAKLELNLMEEHKDKNNLGISSIALCDLETLKQQHRNNWNQIRKMYPKSSKTELRKKGPADFSWLYRHDQEWLNANSPESIKKPLSNRRVNWSDRDEKLLVLVQKAISELLCCNNKPERITIGKIGKKINSLAILQKHMNKLPKTQKLIYSFIEDVESFRLRRVKWAAKIIKENDEPLKQWKIIKVAGLGTNLSKRVVEEIKVLASDKLTDL